MLVSDKKKAKKTIEVGQICELLNSSTLPFFTRRKRYEIENTFFHNGQRSFYIVLVDDDGDKHPLSEKLFESNFKISKIQ